jgi:hypothetical protein
MLQYHEIFPGYDFDKHKGYATALHYERINKLGLTTLHRRSFFDPGFLAPSTQWSQFFYDFSNSIGHMKTEPELEALVARYSDNKIPLPEIEVRTLSIAVRQQLRYLRSEPELQTPLQA